MRAVSVELFDLYADWNELKFGDFVTYLEMQVKNKRSKIFKNII